ncbi:hypothetical protein IGI04_040754 [Brassica rapa subsp. trilocularis]|uniref:Srp40 C-terminal domain-containing protein n=1 Tax=Brassica rapa subsp. trilocularis TaxID=1813537 RepID=A0ABQ7KPG9_BRACM|nr:hypothetical protein IGI04_040754 [Brassica rapa subsp. trilocularis]
MVNPYKDLVSDGLASLFSLLTRVHFLLALRNRGFRHVKTKKKRGSYRGGEIDVRSHSVKFEYSDDE